jgi:hypothetical protein
MKLVVKRWLFGVALTVAVSGTANAGNVVISTLNNPEVGTDDFVTNTNAAMQFTMGSASQALGSVTLDLLGNTGSVTVSLLANAQPFTPGATLLTFGTIDPTQTGFNLYTLATPSSFTLAADATYWVAVAYSHNAETPEPWAYTNSTYNQSGTATTIDLAISSNNGTDWSVGANDTFGPYMFQVNAVPEPSTLVMASIAAFVGLGVGIRKRRTRKSKAVA